jgi:hypothetical protein
MHWYYTMHYIYHVWIWHDIEDRKGSTMLGNTLMERMRHDASLQTRQVTQQPHGTLRMSLLIASIQRFWYALDGSLNLMDLVYV